MILYQPKARWSIATALTWGFASLTTTAMAAVLYFSLPSGVQNTRELVADQCALLDIQRRSPSLVVGNLYSAPQTEEVPVYA